MGLSHSSGKRKQRERVSVFSTLHLVFHFLFCVVLGLLGEICADCAALLRIGGLGDRP